MVTCERAVAAVDRTWTARESREAPSGSSTVTGGVRASEPACRLFMAGRSFWCGNWRERASLGVSRTNIGRKENKTQIGQPKKQPTAVGSAGQGRCYSPERVGRKGRRGGRRGFSARAVPVPGPRAEEIELEGYGDWQDLGGRRDDILIIWLDSWWW